MKHKLSAGILFTDGKKILLLKRSAKDSHPGTWTIPGGKLEKGESLEQAAHRESDEECGYSIGIPFGQFDYKDDKKFFRTYFHAIEKPFKAVVSNEHTEARWCDLDDVDDLELHPKFLEVWDHFKSKIRKKFNKHESFKEWVVRRIATLF
jgi:8-oxo-dGTP diphosphatase